MFEFISAESKQQIKDEIKVEEVDFEEASNKRIHYKSNFLDVYWKVTESIMSRFEYIQVIASIPLLGKNPLWTGSSIIFDIFVTFLNFYIEKFDLYTNNESLEDLYFSSNTFVNRKTALKILWEPSEEAPILNEYNELKYLESGEEVKIAQEAGEARPYTDFFDEFVPNKMEESKRKHKYTVSIHKAIWYAESLEVFKKFDK